MSDDGTGSTASTTSKLTPRNAREAPAPSSAGSPIVEHRDPDRAHAEEGREERHEDRAGNCRESPPASHGAICITVCDRLT